MYFIYAGLSSVFFVLMEIIYKFTNIVKIPARHFVCLWWIMGGIVAFTYFLYNKVYTYTYDYNIFILISIIAILAFTGNLFYFDACKLVNNPGLSRCVFSGTLVLLLTLISIMFFNRSISYTKFLGIIIVIIGLFITITSK